MTKALISALATALAVTASAALAEEGRSTLGYGRIFNNDALGDGKDRWRTGSYAVSKVTGYSYDGVLPSQFGEVREYRLRSELIAPASLTAPVAGDRRYVGALSFGMHSHFTRGGTDFSLGGDLVFTGPQTGMAQFQETVHEWLNADDPVASDTQIGNKVLPTVLAQAARSYQLTDTIQARPYIEAQAGAETLLRFGGDMIIGRVGQSNLKLRDVTTGHLYHATQTDGEGMALVVGGDVAMVTDSYYLPSSDGYDLTDTRTRLRAGVHWEGDKAGVFYGVTWMDKEFEGQTDDQVVGSLRIRLKF